MYSSKGDLQPGIDRHLKIKKRDQFQDERFPFIQYLERSRSSSPVTIFGSMPYLSNKGLSSSAPYLPSTSQGVGGVALIRFLPIER